MNRPRSLAATRLASVALLVVALASLAPHARAQAVKLNDALARSVGGDVVDYLIAPGGDRVVLRADATRDGVYELYSAPAKGKGATVRLNDPLPPYADVGGAGINVFGAGGGWDYAASSTGWVVFLLDLVNDIDELYSTRADGSGSMIRLNGALAPGQRVQKFWLLPDGRDVLYLAREIGEIGLFRVPIDGSGAPEAITPGVVPVQIWLAPDGGRVAYTFGTGSSYRAELWSVPTDGSAAPIRLAITRRPPSSLGSSGIFRVDISDDGACAVYKDVLFEIDDPVDANLLSVPLDGSATPIQLNRAPVSTFEDYTFDGVERVLFHEPIDLVSVSVDGSQRTNLTPAGWTPEAYPALLTTGGTDVVFAVRSGFSGALYRALLDGAGPAVQLVATGSRIRSFQLAPTCAIFTTFDAPSELVAVPLAGGATRVLNPAPFDESALDWRVHPDGDELYFRAQPGGTGVMELFSVPIDGRKLPRPLNAPLIPAGDVDRYTFSEDGGLVVYRADQLANEALEVFGLPSPFHRVVAYGPPLASGPVVGDVQSFQISADEKLVLYRADQDIDQVFGLYLASADGRVPPRSVTALLDERSPVYTGSAFTPDSRRVVFLQADSAGSASGNLYSIGTTPSAAPVLLDSRGRLRAQQLVVDPSSARVVYRRQRTLFGSFDELCSSRVDGTEPPLTLTPPSGDVSAFRLTPDGAAAIYLADHDRAGVIELWRVPLDGSAPAVRLHPALRASADVRAFDLTPDGRQVVFLGDLDTDQRDELYVVPSDGSSPPVKRSGALVAGGNVTHFVVTSSGASVVYRADQRVDDTFELFGFPLAGGPDVVLAPLPAGDRVLPDFVVSADGRHVVYRVNATPGGVRELFRAPLDGSAAPTLLSAPLVAGGHVQGFEVASDAGRVVYLADQRIDEVHELWSVPLAGGPPTLLEMLSASADVTDFRIAPDAETVFFRADLDADDVYELYGVSIAGRGPTRRVTLRLPPHADVLPDFVPLSGGRAVHRVDLEEDAVMELYVGYLDHSYRSAEK